MIKKTTTSERRKLSYSEMGALGGSSVSHAKRKAARENGAAGGRPPIWQCPDCETTGSSGAPARTRLQIIYRAGAAVRITCWVCGAHGRAEDLERWLVDAQ